MGLSSTGLEIDSTLAGTVGSDAGVVGFSAVRSTRMNNDAITYIETFFSFEVQWLMDSEEQLNYMMQMDWN